MNEEPTREMDVGRLRRSSDPLDLRQKILGGRFRVDGLADGVDGKDSYHYIGFDLSEKRTVTILFPSMIGAVVPQDELLTFIGQARLLIGLTHPALVTLHDCGVLGQNIPYMIVEIVKGASLAEEIARRAPAARHFDAREIREIFEPVLDALAYAHEHGVVHGSLSPWKIRLAREGASICPKLTDLGFGGSTKDPNTEKKEIHAMAGILRSACLLRIESPETRADLRKARPDLPRSLVRCLERATSRSAEDHYASGRDFLTDFRAAVSTGRSATAGPKARGLSWKILFALIVLASGLVAAHFFFAWPR